MEFYKDRLEAILAEAFLPLTLKDEALQSVRTQIALALLSVRQTDFSTGLIIAGYGAEDTFPSIATVDIDGVVLNRLKRTKVIDAASIKSKDRGHVVSFAQTDVIERLLAGVDPRYVNEMADFIEGTIEKAGKELEKVDSRKRISIKEKNARSATIKDLANLARREYLETSKKRRTSLSKNLKK